MIPFLINFKKSVLNNFNLSSNGKKYLFINFTSVLLFAILYYINDYFIINNLEFAKKLGFVKKDYKLRDNKVNSIIYYIWFSLITQTTLGYTGILNEKTGLNVPFSKLEYNSYKFLNIMQISSIFIYASLFI
jgi:hypothetical protein|tara:strand:- start:4615 stop:5010 length:396 start_codon:yes stop_codon:yes gene_type:complete